MVVIDLLWVYNDIQGESIFDYEGIIFLLTLKFFILILLIS